MYVYIICVYVKCGVCLQHTCSVVTRCWWTAICQCCAATFAASSPTSAVAMTTTSRCIATSVTFRAHSAANCLSQRRRCASTWSRSTNARRPWPTSPRAVRRSSCQPRLIAWFRITPTVSEILFCFINCEIPWKGPSRFLTEGRMSMTKSGLVCVYCVYCV